MTDMEARAKEFLVNKHGEPDCGEANGWINEVATECSAFADQQSALDVAAAVREERERIIEIGRASCRERVSLTV